MKYKLEGDPAAEALCNPEKITEALQLAAQDARRLHKQTGHPIVVWEDGKVVWIPPEEIVVGDEDADGDIRGITRSGKPGPPSG